MGQMGKWQCTTTGLDNSTELQMEKNSIKRLQRYGFQKSGSPCPTDSSFMLELSVRQSETDKMHARLTMIGVVRPNDLQ